MSQIAEVNGRMVIIINDVLDQGVIAKFAFGHFLVCGATNIKFVTMIEKDIARSTIAHADLYLLSYRTRMAR